MCKFDAFSITLTKKKSCISLSQSESVRKYCPGGRKGEGGRGNSSSTLVPMREEENAWKGVFFRDGHVYARTRKKGGKIGLKQEKRYLFQNFEEKRVKGDVFKEKLSTWTHAFFHGKSRV